MSVNHIFKIIVSLVIFLYLPSVCFRKSYFYKYWLHVLGTSINTSFGTRIQNMFVELGLAQGSLIKGMDIEFTDKIDNRKR